MRVWLYYRLSRDEDEELNSLMNQRSIIESYALKSGHTIVGESCDDNISGRSSPEIHLLLPGHKAVQHRSG